MASTDVEYLQDEWDSITVTPAGQTAVVDVKNTVGIVGLPSGDSLYLTPKVEANLLYLLAYTDRVSERVVRDREPAAFEAGESLPELLGELLRSELDHIIIRGLDSAYEQQTGTERYVRGQIQVDRQVQRHGPTSTQFECRYQSLTHDIPINQVLLAATDTLVRLLPPSGIRSELLQYRALLAEHVTLPSSPEDALDSVSLTRLNDYYQAALLLAELILQERLLQGFESPTRPFPSMVFDMLKIFEDAVVEAVGESIDRETYRVTTNDLGEFARSTDDADPRRLEPDFVIRRRTQDPEQGNPIAAVGDAKWKSTDSFSTGDFYQIATYQSYAGTPGLLVYPPGEIEPREYEYNQNSMIGLDEGDSSTGDDRGPLIVRQLETSTTVETYTDYCDKLERSLTAPVNQVLSDST